MTTISIECDNCLNDAVVVQRYLGGYLYWCNEHIPRQGSFTSLIPNGKREKEKV